MTAILHNGDYQPDGFGGIRRAEGTQALLQEALFRLQCRRGAFPMLPELGSRLYLLTREKPSARTAAARQYAAEALEGLDAEAEDAWVQEKETDLAVRVVLRAAGVRETLGVTV